MATSTKGSVTPGLQASACERFGRYAKFESMFLPTGKNLTLGKIPCPASRRLGQLGGLLALILAGCMSESALPLEPLEDEWVLGVLPDTQGYAARCPEMFTQQTEWLADHRDPLALAFVIHLGDLTDDGTPAQWQTASDAMGALDGRVPYSVLPGNHDIGVLGNAANRDGELAEWFPAARFSTTLIADYPIGSMANSFHRFSPPQASRDVCVLAMEFGPREQSVTWAEEILAANDDCLTVLATHAYLHDDGERYDERLQTFHPATYGVASEGVTDGQGMFERLVLPFSQVSVVLCGHALGTGVARRLDMRADGTHVVQILSNYQERGPCGGDGLLRLLAFGPTGVRVHTFSPVTGEQLSDDANAFQVTLP